MTGTTPGRVSVIVLARQGQGDELHDVLGVARADALAALQLARAQAWAAATFSAQTVELRTGGLAEVIAGTGPIGTDDALVVVVPELATWRTDLGGAALDDLRAGCALSVGPIFDGGLYLLAATRSGVELLRDRGGRDGGTDGVDLGGRGAMAGLVGLAERAEIEVGLLRTERGLRSAGDVRALLVDPLCDEELRRVLG